MPIPTAKKAKCPCGAILDLYPYFRTSTGKWELYDLKCPECGALCTSFNGETGEVLGWLTARQIERANREYAEQMFSADMNEFYGRGNHCF